MRKLTQISILGSFVLLNSVVYADDLRAKLVKLGMQIERAEIFAANCAVDSKIDKKIHLNCIDANMMLEQANARLAHIATLNADNTNEIAENIKQLQVKISRTNEQLTEAKIVTGDYEWTNNFIPSISP